MTAAMAPGACRYQSEHLGLTTGGNCPLTRMRTEPHHLQQGSRAADASATRSYSATARSRQAALGDRSPTVAVTVYHVAVSVPVTQLGVVWVFVS
jgi:hypothetical protein